MAQDLPPVGFDATFSFPGGNTYQISEIAPHPTDPDVVYVGANRVLKSDWRGEGLYPISDELTRADEEKIRISTTTTGGITPDVTGAETFATIRTHFQELFRKLFGGGQADMILEDENDVLECGIEIIARDRSGGYGAAAKQGRPEAKQVADRWHLMANASAAFLVAVRRDLAMLPYKAPASGP